MNKSLHIILVLTGFSIIAGAALVSYAIYTQPMIDRNAEFTLRAAISEVLPGTESYGVVKRTPETTIYESKDKSGNLKGYAVYQVGTGFADKIVLLFGTDPGLQKVIGLKILEQKETPGLGALIESEEVFLQFWKDKEFSDGFIYSKPPKDKEKLASNEINAISGATISSKSVTEIVNKAFATARKELRR